MLTGPLWSWITNQLLPTAHMSACKSYSTLGMLLTMDVWVAIICTLLRGINWMSLSSLDWLSPVYNPDHQVSSPLCLVLFSFLSRADFFLLLALGFSSANKLSFQLLSVFASSMATLASKALLLSGVFLPLMSPAFFQSLNSCWHCAINAKPYSSVDYFFSVSFLQHTKNRPVKC